MDDGLTPLRRLGAAVACAQDGAETGAVDQARERLFAAPANRWKSRRLSFLAAALVVGALVFAVGWGARDQTLPALTFSVSGSPGAAESWVSVPAGATSTMSFSDGTQIWLASGTRARVGALGTQGAEVHVERGGAHVAVVHREKTAWRFEAGPYDVFVTGTEFSVSWNPAQEHFRLELVEGSVEVAGPRIEGRRIMVAGQTLDLRAAPETAAVVPIELETAPAAAHSPEAEAQSSPRRPTPMPLATADVDVSDEEDWRTLASEGKYPEAYAAAAPAFDAILQSASASDLMVLADVARYAGRAARSRQAYRTVRARFAGSSQAARAAFALGRGGGGAKWFSLYLEEAPDGPLAREALGRLLESQGHRPSALATARRYLARYPDGPHARLARSIVQAAKD